MVFLIYADYLDRNAIALARLDDLEEDLNLSSTQYQTCVSILFVGYLLGKDIQGLLYVLWLKSQQDKFHPTCSSTELALVATWALA